MIEDDEGGYGAVDGGRGRGTLQLIVENWTNKPINGNNRNCKLWITIFMYCKL